MVADGDDANDGGGGDYDDGGDDDDSDDVVGDNDHDVMFMMNMVITSRLSTASTTAVLRGDPGHGKQSVGRARGNRLARAK